VQSRRSTRTHQQYRTGEPNWHHAVVFERTQSKLYLPLPPFKVTGVESKLPKWKDFNTSRLVRITTCKWCKRIYKHSISKWCDQIYKHSKSGNVWHHKWWRVQFKLGTSCCLWWQFSRNYPTWFCNQAIPSKMQFTSNAAGILSQRAGRHIAPTWSQSIQESKPSLQLSRGLCTLGCSHGLGLDIVRQRKSLRYPRPFSWNFLINHVFWMS